MTFSRENTSLIKIRRTNNRVYYIYDVDTSTLSQIVPIDDTACPVLALELSMPTQSPEICMADVRYAEPSVGVSDRKFDWHDVQLLADDIEMLITIAIG